MPKFDPSRPVQTRDGRKARIVCVDMKRDHYPILALVENPNGLESPPVLHPRRKGVVL